jgi:hypothetical protein
VAILAPDIVPLVALGATMVLACECKLTSGHRISTTFNGQNHFGKVAGSKVLDEDYNTYLRK